MVFCANDFFANYYVYYVNVIVEHQNILIAECSDSESKLNLCHQRSKAGNALFINGALNAMNA